MLHAYQCCQIKFLKIHERSFEKFRKSSRMEFEDRTSSETVGNRRKTSKTVGMYGNSRKKYKETLEQGMATLYVFFSLY